MEPPAGVPLGERVTFEGYSGEPEEVLVPKKRIFEQVRVRNETVMCRNANIGRTRQVAWYGDGSKGAGCSRKAEGWP